MKFVPVRLNTLRADDNVTFDVHLRLSEKTDHYVHYVKRADVLEESLIQKLKKKGVKKVFISETDEEHYLDYLDRGLISLEGKNIAPEQKATLVHDTLNTQAENAERALETEKGYLRMQGQLGKIVDHFVSEKGTLKNLLAASGVAIDYSEHSANVTSLSIGVATLAGIVEPRDLLDLSIACLVHDIGAKKFSIDPTADRKTFRGEELKKFMAHPAEGVALLAGKKFITPRVLALVADHEELGEGAGFPERKRIEKLMPISQILNMCNAFDRFCMIQKASPKQAIDPFFEAFSEKVVLSHLSILASVVTAG